MTETRDALLVDAFGRAPLDGLRTGVVPDGAGLDGRAVAIATELGGTVALLGSGDGDRQLRVEGEGGVERGAVAAYGALDALGRIDGDEHTVRTADGSRTVELDAPGVWVETTVPDWRPGADRDPETLGVPGGEVIDVPLGTAGGRAVVGVGYLSALADGVAEGAVGFTFETLDPDAHVHVREGDGPAGPAACLAVCAALAANEVFDGDFPDALVCETGHHAGREAELRVDPTGRVGGPVAVSLSGDLTLPDPEDDDIIVG